jgi:hypothetical protein
MTLTNVGGFITMQSVQRLLDGIATMSRLEFAFRTSSFLTRRYRAQSCFFSFSNSSSKVSLLETEKGGCHQGYADD